MPKSKRTAKSKLDGLSAEDMSKDQLEEHILRLREELDREREERSYFQLERDKIQTFWEISKRRLEEAQADRRSRHREREEEEERHRVEITLFKQKLKHFLSEQHDAASDRKFQRAASASLVQIQHTEAELALHRDRHGRKEDFRDKRLHNQTCRKELQLKQQVALMEEANRCDRRVREMEARHQEDVQTQAEVQRRKQAEEIQELEDRMKSRVVVLVQDQDRALRGVEEFYSAALLKVKEDQKLLEEELAAAAAQQARADRKLPAAQQENKRLNASLLEGREKLPEVERRWEERRRDKEEALASRARLKLREEELRDLTVEHQLLLHAFQQAGRERDQLLKEHTDAVLDVQQKTGLKELLLERRVAALTEAVEKKEAGLCAALTASAADSNAANKLQVIRESKQAAAGALACDLAAEREEYEQLLQSCTEELQALGAPPDHRPFRSSEQILGGPASAH